MYTYTEYCIEYTNLPWVSRFHPEGIILGGGGGGGGSCSPPPHETLVLRWYYLFSNSIIVYSSHTLLPMSEEQFSTFGQRERPAPVEQ